MRVGLREANQHFSALIRKVKAGKEITLTERGRPVAVVKPVEPAKAEDWDAIHERLAAEGFLIPASRKGPMPRHRPIKLKGPPITETLRQMRDEE